MFSPPALLLFLPIGAFLFCIFGPVGEMMSGGLAKLATLSVLSLFLSPSSTVLTSFIVYVKAVAAAVDDDVVNTFCCNCCFCTEVDDAIGGNREVVPAKRLTGVGIIPEEVMPDECRRLAALFIEVLVIPVPIPVTGDMAFLLRAVTVPRGVFSGVILSNIMADNVLFPLTLGRIR